VKVTALEEYGLRCMVRLARAGHGQALSLAEIGDSEGVSIPYAGRLMGLLKDGGLVTSERGRNGGYTLTRDPAEIPLKDVFDSLGEPLFGSNHCERFQTDGGSGGPEGCVHHGDCSVRDVWSAFHRLIEAYLDQITLEDLARKRTGLGVDLVRLVEEKMRRPGHGSDDVPSLNKAEAKL
jgi:Rrf2 family protein